MSKPKITAQKLLNFGFSKNNDGIYYKGNYGLKYEYGNWLIINNDFAQDLTTKELIETIEELKKHYKKVTNKDL